MNTMRIGMIWVALSGIGCAVGVDEGPGGEMQRGVEVNQQSLEGTWRTTCHAMVGGGGVVREITFSDDHLTFVQFQYATRSCESLRSAVTFDATFDDRIEPDSKSRRLTQQMIDASVLVVDDQGAVNANSKEMCGHTDWQPGQSREVFACDVSGHGMFVGRGIEVYSAVRTIGDDRLLIADGSSDDYTTLANNMGQMPSEVFEDNHWSYRREVGSKPAN